MFNRHRLGFAGGLPAGAVGVSACIALLVTGSAPARAGVTLPAGFTATPLGSVSAGSCMVIAPGGNIYIGQQGGELRVWTPGGGVAPTAIHVFNVDPQGERGLIGLEVDPGFATNRFLYAHISRAGPTVGGSIRRLTLNAAGTAVVAGSEVEIFYIGDYGPATNHNGGALHFGADGKLYISVGENATPDFAQSLANLFGKILRINADGSIPSDNPTTFSGISGSPSGQNRAIWAVGLRNPFTFNIQPGTGRMFINDVGSGTWEEINEGAPGRNFGWPTTEGPFSSFPAFTHPLVYYHHTDSGQSMPPDADFTGFAITGGVFYNPPTATFPADYLGDYFFGDLRGWVRRYDPAAGTVTTFATDTGAVIDLRVDALGRLVMLTRGGPSPLTRIAFGSGCAADFNNSGSLTVQDIFDFLAAYFSNNPAADFNGQSGITVQDIFDFLAAYFTGCA